MLVGNFAKGKGMLKKTFVIFFALFVTNVFANDGSFVSTDLSLNYLRMVFGTVGNALVAISNPADNLIAGLFNIFNMGIMVFASGFVAYTVYHNTISTAQDGGLTGSGKSNAWPAFRIILGLSLISPMYNGYSMMQETVMWAAVSGANVASSIWTEAVNHIAKTGGGVLAPSHNTNDADFYKIAANTNSKHGNWAPAERYKNASLSDIMASASCLAVLSQKASDEVDLMTTKLGVAGNRAFDAAIRTGKNCAPVAYNGLANSTSAKLSANTICFGVKTNPSICGSYTWNFKIDSVSSQEKFQAESSLKGLLQQAGLVYFSNMQNQYKNILNFLDSHASRSDVNYSTLSSARVALAKNDNLDFKCDPKNNNSKCFLSLNLANDSKNYINTLFSARIKSEDQSDGEKYIQQWAKSAKDRGWIVAGQSYSNFASNENLPLEELLAIENFQIKVQDQVNQDYLNLISNNSFAFCIQDKSSTAKSIKFNNLGKTIGDLNSTYDTGGTISLDPKGKYQVAACILANTLPLLAKGSLNIINKQLTSADLTEKPLDSDLVASNLDSVTGAAMKVLLQDNVFETLQSKNEVLAGQPVYLDVVEDNLTAMILNIYSKMLGFYPFASNEDGRNLADTFSDGSKNAAGKIFPQDFSSSCINARNFCLQESENNYQGCFQNAVDVECIKPGQGILGSLYTGQKGNMVDQIMLLSNLGISMLNNAVLYWTQTMQGVYKVGMTLVKRYMTTMGIMSGASIPFAIAGASTGTTKFFDRLNGIAAFVLKSTNAFLSLEFKYVLLAVGLYLPFGAVLASIFFGLGVTLGLYLPLIPFLTFLFGAIGWIIAVIEAMVAAPLIALGLTHPVGHDLLGKAEQAVMLLLSVFVRPAAMVIGFIFSISLIFVAMEIFNIGFLSVIVNYMVNINNISSDGESATIMIGFCGMLLVYAYIALNVVNQCFSLIYLVPEKLLRWIGGAPEFSYTSQLLQDIHSGAKDASSQVGQGAGDSIKTPMVRPGINAEANIPKSKLKDEDGNIIYDDEGKAILVGWYDLMKKPTVAGVVSNEGQVETAEDKSQSSNKEIESVDIKQQTETTNKPIEEIELVDLSKKNSDEA